MAILTITESDKIGCDSEGKVVMALPLPAVAEQAVPISASPNPSQPFNPKTRYIMVNCDVACCLAAGDPNATPAPTAVNGFHRMGANETRFYPVTPGHVLSVIQFS